MTEPLALALPVLQATLFAMVPITLASLGEVFAEKAGVVNIGLEGIMLIGALTGAIGAELAGNPIAGFTVGAVTGAVIGLIHGFISVHLKGDQIISGVGINVFALGFVAFGIIATWKVAGYHQVPNEAKMSPLVTPLGSFSPMILVVVLLVGLTHYFLTKTELGLRVKAVGENPEAADSVGLPVEKIRLLATVYGASLAGLAGAYMSIDYLSTITKELTAGRGFIALANVVFSRWEPLLTLAGGLLFGFFDTAAIWIVQVPGVKELIPFHFILMIPYVATLAAVSGVIGKARAPKSLGIAYRRE